MLRRKFCAVKFRIKFSIYLPRTVLMTIPAGSIQPVPFRIKINDIPLVRYGMIGFVPPESFDIQAGCPAECGIKFCKFLTYSLTSFQEIRSYKNLSPRCIKISGIDLIVIMIFESSFTVSEN